MGDTLTSNELLTELQTRYDGFGNVKYSFNMEWMFFTEVGVGSGLSRIDALAVNLFPSRADSDCMHGFEIKVSRTDWLNELRRPDKSEPWRKLCNRWYLVAGNADIIKSEEVPKDWGLIVPCKNGKGIRTAKKSPINHNAIRPCWRLMCSLMRKSFEQYTPTQENLRLRRKAESDLYDAQKLIRKLRAAGMGNDE